MSLLNYTARINYSLMRGIFLDCDQNIFEEHGTFEERLLRVVWIIGFMNMSPTAVRWLAE